MRIEADERLERRLISQQRGRRGAEQFLAKLGEKLHASQHIIATAIPFDDRELGIMPLALLVLAKGVRHLVNRLAASRQQALHGELRRSLQPKLPLCVAARSGNSYGERIQVPVDHGIGREQRRLDF